jgi:hypothetical protein
MSPIVLIVALVFGLVAAAHYVRAIHRVQPYLTPSFRNPMTTWHALDALVWLRSMPVQARRDYILSLVYSGIFVACIGVLAYREGSRVVAVIFAGILVIGMAMTALRRVRTRNAR